MKKILVFALLCVFFVSCGGEEETLANLSSIPSSAVETDSLADITDLNSFNVYEEEAVVMETRATGDVHTFTNCDQTGQTGPSQAQCNTAYAGTPLNGKVTVTSGIQYWTVPVTGKYKIEGYGAQGARNGGLGARIIGEFDLTAGEIIKIVVGQQGSAGTNDTYTGGGGGGGSFVVRFPYNTNASIAVVAGGGGGYTNFGVTTTMNGRSSTDGGDTNNDGGGNSGNGGNSGLTDGPAAGGGGFFTDGTNGNYGDVLPVGGKSFINGAVGGTEGHNTGHIGGDGGFGGGGGGLNNSFNRSGGGGGYSGGQGGTWDGQ
ncbi:MAG TPA: hypothetical protein VLJ60_01365, partial [bacterium]|nr:hypothetical protein [bacterium]